MSISFSDMLDQKAAEAEKPKTVPVGDYNLKILKAPTFRADHEDYEFLEFWCRPIQAVEVDEDDLADFGSLDNALLKKSFVFNKNDKNAFLQTQEQLQRFLIQHCAAGDDSMTNKELLDGCVGCEFKGEVTAQPDKKDPETIRVEIKKTWPLDD